MIRALVNTAAVAGAVALTAPIWAAGPLQITSQVLVEQRGAASDGSTRVRLVPAARAGRATG